MVQSGWIVFSTKRWTIKDTCSMKHLIVSFLFVLNSYLLFAQTVDIHGIVYGDSESPRSNCEVMTSQHKYTRTDSLGRYTVTVPVKGKTEITFKSPGYKDIVFLWSQDLGQVSVDIRMERDSSAVLGPDAIVVRVICTTPILSPYDNGYYLLHKYAIPEDCDEIVIYTQYRSAKKQKEKELFGIDPYLCTYVIRFQDSITSSVVKNKIFKGKFLRLFKRIPIENLSIEGFHLLYTDIEKNDPVAQQALRTVKEYGLHYYGKQDTPVFYFMRDGK